MRFLKRRVVRKLGQPQQSLKLLHVRKEGDDATIVGPEELLQGQHREQLPLGEVVPGKLRGVGG